MLEKSEIADISVDSDTIRHSKSKISELKQQVVDLVEVICYIQFDNETYIEYSNISVSQLFMG